MRGRTSWSGSETRGRTVRAMTVGASTLAHWRTVSQGRGATSRAQAHGRSRRPCHAQVNWSESESPRVAGRLHAFSAGKYSRQDHIEPHDDR